MPYVSEIVEMLMNWILLLSIVIILFSLNVIAQSQIKYDHFYFEINKSGKAVALFFLEGNNAGCSEMAHANGAITSVDWDIVVIKFSANLSTGKRSFVVPDTLNQISNADRGFLSDIFRKGNRVRVTWRECGSGNTPKLIGVKGLR